MQNYISTCSAGAHVESKKDDVCKWCAHVLSHLELSVRPSAHLGWTGLDWIHVLCCIWVILCFIFASCLKLSVRPMDLITWTGPIGTHWHSLSVRPSLDRTGLSSWLTLWGPAEPIRSLYPFSFVDPLNLQDTAETLRYPHPVPAPVAV